MNSPPSFPVTDPRSLDDVLHHCLHCGLCLPVCPTYALTMNEQSSPRGRIRIMKEVFEGKMEITDRFAAEMYFCLDCQACQTICPAGVNYGSLVEEARWRIARAGKEPPAQKLVKSAMLGIVASRWKTKIWASILRLYRAIGLREAVEKTGILKLFSPRLHEQQQLLPDIHGSSFSSTVAECLKPRGKRRGTVAFLSGCMMDAAFANVHRDAIEVLLINGYEVIIPKQQQCCGSLHAHNGEMEQAHALARKNIDVFGKYEFDALIVDSAGCGAFMKEYGAQCAGDPVYAAKAAAFSAKVKDISEFLSSIELLPPPNPIAKRVTYDDACHLVHTQKISSEPRAILRSIPGLELIELPEATWCCGSAGIYNILRFDDSMQMLERKMNNIASTRADILVTANPGCHLQLQYGIKKYGLNMEVMHPVSLLRRSYDPVNASV